MSPTGAPQHLQAENIPAAVSPFQRPDSIEPAASLALGADEEVQGWIIAHRL